MDAAIFAFERQILPGLSPLEKWVKLVCFQKQYSLFVTAGKLHSHHTSEIIPNNVIKMSTGDCSEGLEDSEYQLAFAFCHKAKYLQH